MNKPKILRFIPHLFDEISFSTSSKHGKKTGSWNRQSIDQSAALKKKVEGEEEKKESAMRNC